VAVVAVVAVVAGCSNVARHSGLTEDEARERALLVALQERSERDSDLYRVKLTLGELEARTTRGDEYWYATLVDAQAIPRICIRIRGGLSGSVGVRRCDPEGAPPPSAPVDDDGPPSV
jgi:hypothetical protein